MGNINISFVGAGNIVKNYHLPLLKNIPDFNINGIYDLNKSTSKAISKLYNCKYYENFNDCLYSDVILIATPVSARKDYYNFFLDNKKAIFVEKPISTNYSLHKSLKLLESKNKNKIYLGLMRRYFKNIQLVKKLIKLKIFGDLEKVEAYEGVESHRIGIDKNHYQNQYEANVILETGVHLIDQVTYALDVSSYQKKKLNRKEYKKFVYDIDLELIFTTSFHKDVECQFKISYSKFLENKIIFYFNNGQIILKNNSIEKVSYFNEEINLDIVSNNLNKFASTVLQSFYLEWLDFLNYYKGKEYITNPLDSLIVSQIIEDVLK